MSVCVYIYIYIYTILTIGMHWDPDLGPYEGPWFGW